VEDAVTDACVPIKIIHGHVADLIGKVDYLFVPRLVSVRDRLVFCPKFLGLPDMIRYSITNLPQLIDIRVDLRKGRLELWRIACRVGRILGAGLPRTAKAYWAARSAWKELQARLQARQTAPEAFAEMCGVKTGAEKAAQTGPKSLRFAVLGYPYAIHDPYVSGNLVARLQSLGVEVVTADMLPRQILRQQSKHVRKQLFWTYSDEALRAGYYFYEHGGVDGVIHITAFSCGPDAVVDKLLELEAKRRGTIPFISLMIDEHTGDAGIATRLEAFSDMVRRRKERRRVS
jgi:predicted nucleotide-binding protein (sugar kinase/HSP70/actin superfamily)